MLDLNWGNDSISSFLISNIFLPWGFIITDSKKFSKFRNIYLGLDIYSNGWWSMKVKVFDEAHEKDLENTLNGFLNSGDFDIIDIKFNVAIAVCGEEQIYCFSALVMYN